MKFNNESLYFKNAYMNQLQVGNSEYLEQNQFVTCYNYLITKQKLVLLRI